MAVKGAGMEQKTNVDEIHLSDCWQAIVKRKKMVMGFLFVSVAVTLLLSFSMPPVYQATAKMFVERESTTSPVTGQRMEVIDGVSQQLTFNTHFTLIKSKPVIQSLLANLDISREERTRLEEGFATNILEEVVDQVMRSYRRIKKNLGVLFGVGRSGLSEQERLDKSIAAIQSIITIKNVRKTRLLDISVMDNDPEMAAKIANLLAKKYIEFDLASKLASANQNQEWLNKEVYAMKKRLEDDERKFFAYKQLNKVFSINGKQRVIDQKITDLNNEYMATKNRRQELEAKLAEIDKQYANTKNIAHIRSILNNKAIDDIYANLTNLELEQSRLAKVFKSKHPKIQQISSEIAKVRLKLKSELNREIENLKVQRTVFQNREKVMEQNIREYEQDALDTSGKELNYTILQRNMETSQNLYDTLVAKMKESGVAAGNGASSIRLVASATVPSTPVKPNKKMNLLLSILFGLFGGVVCAFVLEYFDQSLKTKEDVQNVLGLPVLSVVPIADKDDEGGYY